MTTRLILAGLGLALLAGCGKSTYPVNGRIAVPGETVSPKELTDYLVMLQSVDQPVGATGVVQPDGTFRVSTHQPNDGAIPGKHKAVIVPPAGMGGDAPRPRSALDPKYEAFETSGLEVDVKPQTNDVTLTVQRRKK